VEVVLFAFCPSAAVYVEAVRPRLVVTSAAAARGPVGAACRALGVSLEIAPDVNAPELVARVAALRPDLLIVAGCPQIFGREIRETPRLGAVNVHPSLLPRYRGREPLFWAILHGEPEVGVTVHRLTEQVDAGPILAQRSLPVPSRATTATLTREVDALGAELVRDLLASCRTTLPEGRPQLGPASRFPPLRPEHGRIDWSRSATEIDRLVRACSGEIDAHTYFEGMKLIVFDAHEATSDRTGSAVPGEVLDVSERGLLVATADGMVALRRFLFMDRGHDAASIARELGIRAGARL